MSNLIFPRFKATDGNGKPIRGGLLYTYTAGTSNAKSVYTDYELTSAATNPVVLDSNGEALIYLSGTYKMNLKTADGAQVPGWPVDNVADFGTGFNSIIIGTGAEVDTSLIFDGNTYDYHIGLDDSADTMVFGRGNTVGSLGALSIDSTLRVIFGHTVGISVGGASPRLQVKGTDVYSGITLSRNSNDAVGPRTIFGKSRNASIGSYTIVQDDDILGEIIFAGDDGTDLNTIGATIRSSVDGSPAENSIPADLEFKIGATTAVLIDASSLVYMPVVATHDIAADDNEVALYIDPDDGEMGYNSSIREAKTNIEDIGDTSWVYALKPRVYNRRKKDKDGTFTDNFYTNKEFGLIAEEVEDVIPEQLTFKIKDKDADIKKLAGVKYERLIPVLLNEIQKLNARIEALENA